MFSLLFQTLFFTLTFWNWKSSFWILIRSAVGWLALPQMSLSILLPPLLTAPCAECIMLAAEDMTSSSSLGLSPTAPHWSRTQCNGHYVRQLTDPGSWRRGGEGLSRLSLVLYLLGDFTRRRPRGR